MLSEEVDIIVALHWWCWERIAPNNHITASEEIQESTHLLETVAPFIFQTLDYLYVSIEHIPTPWTSKIPGRGKTGGKRSLAILNFPPPQEYLLLRSLLSLTSDIQDTTGSLLHKTKGNLMELEPLLKNLRDSTNHFIDVRNLFTHLGERLLQYDKHGITGATKTKYGLEFSDDAEDNLYIVFSEDTIHFSFEKRPMDVDIGKPEFKQIFESAQLIYSEITSHKVHAQLYHYPPVNQIYPL